MGRAKRQPWINRVKGGFNLRCNETREEYVGGLAKKWFTLGHKVVFVAEGRMNLARPFEAGIEGANSCPVASATIESIFQPSLTRRGLVALAVIPALKDRVKIKPPLRGEEKAAQIPEGRLLGKVYVGGLLT